MKADPIELLRARTSEKWVTYPDDVLPLFVAETDYPIAPVVAEAVIDRVRASDTGYVSDASPAARAFAGFAGRRWDWALDPSLVRCTTDVSVAIVEVLRVLLEPGSRVAIMPPVYPPFFGLVPEAGHTTYEVPLVDRRIDLAGVEAAFVDGVKAVLLCHPHNPIGVPHPADDLRALAELAREHGAFVVSDEIHGPLTHPDGHFVPFLDTCAAAREVGVCVTSASKGWNIAGFKCAMIVADDPAVNARLDRMSEEVLWRTSILGMHASAAAFTHGAEWLDATIAAMVESRRLLTSLLAEHLPEVDYREPTASYLAWLDLRALADDPNPAARILTDAKVALTPGPDFGAPGVGHVRLNLACSAEMLTAAVERIATTYRS
ncbi:cystathionine beta-lyase [Flexivirga oryzae]|uniref:cysteine-S-conjugate beta-lyase n=1 Tax=Flexivirga oryzae TaxID=1794944 RepID=A0A839N6R0_9MICO|nr:cystathionine beta-lyase [Flexivirga oryzae]